MRPPIILHLTFGPHLVAYSNGEAHQYFQCTCLGLAFKTLCRDQQLFDYLDAEFKKVEKETNSSMRFLWQSSEKIMLWTLKPVLFHHNGHSLKMLSLTGQLLI